MAKTILDKPKPCFVPPPGTCDVHCHVYADDPRFLDHRGDRLLTVHRALGVERAVIVQANPESRAVTLAALALAGGRYRGLAVVDDGTSEAELAALHTAGIRGARFPFTARHGGTPDLAAMLRLIERIKPMGWHVDFLIGPEDIRAHLDFIRAISIPVVIDHMGRTDAAAGLDDPAFKQLLELAKRDHIWIKLSGADRISASGPPFHDALPYIHALLAAAPSRVLWGTDWPHPNNRFNPDVRDLVDLIPLIAPDEADRQRLLVDNPARLYGFTP